MSAKFIRQIATGLFATLFIVFAAQAEENNSPIIGFRADPDAPIEIEADTLVVEQADQQATFIGSVVAVQGAMTLTADQLVVTYAAKDASETSQDDETGSGTQVQQIHATGNVHVMSEDDQSADGQWAIYEVANSEITMGDEVVLRQGENVIRGKRLQIDLNTGRARVDGGVSTTDGENGSSGRVRGLFQSPQQ